MNMYCIIPYILFYDLPRASHKFYPPLEFQPETLINNNTTLNLRGYIVISWNQTRMTHCITPMLLSLLTYNHCIKFCLTMQLWILFSCKCIHCLIHVHHAILCNMPSVTMLKHPSLLRYHHEFELYCTTHNLS